MGEIFINRNVYPCDRQQYIGYARLWYELKGDRSRVTFVVFANTAIKPQGAEIVGRYKTQQEAWDAFGVALKEYLKDKPGVILWRMEPQAENDNGWYVICRIAVTEDMRFTDKNAVILDD